MPDDTPTVDDLLAEIFDHLEEAYAGQSTHPSVSLLVRARDALEDLAATLRAQTAENERLKDAEQGWIDRSCYYRNTAVQAGADPAMFDNEYDQALARDSVGCCADNAKLERALAEARAAQGCEWMEQSDDGPRCSLADAGYRTDQIPTDVTRNQVEEAVSAAIGETFNPGEEASLHDYTRFVNDTVDAMWALLSGEGSADG